MTPRVGEMIAEARRARQLTLRQLANQVTKEDGSPLSPPSLNGIELHHRLPTPHLLWAFARVLAWDYDRLLASAGAIDTVVREYVAAYPQHTEAVIRLFRAAHRQGFEDWERLQALIERGGRPTR